MKNNIEALIKFMKSKALPMGDNPVKAAVKQWHRSVAKNAARAKQERLGKQLVQELEQMGEHLQQIAENNNKALQKWEEMNR